MCVVFVVVVIVVVVVAAAVVVVIIVVMFLPTYFLIQAVYRKQGRALVPSVIPAPLCNDFKKL